MSSLLLPAIISSPLPFPTLARMKAIDQQSVLKIGAGQVVVSLSVAIKELLENSLDAGASSIEIRLKEYGLQSIQVSDNGIGIPSSDFDLLCKRNRTSKLQSFSDLENLSSFGFRGEALNSLALTCKEVVITTKSKEENCVGFKLTFRGDKLITKETMARSEGTCVMLNQLFHSFPVRRREFEKNFKREFQKSISLMQSYAIISTNVKISCFNMKNQESEMIFQTFGNATIKENAMNIFGVKMIASLTSFNWPIENYEFEGLISTSSGRSSGDRQYIFVNGRPTDQAKVKLLLMKDYKSIQ